jgi:hypothetical protein
MRIFKLYKLVSAAMEKRNSSQSDSLIGNKLSDMTTKRLILLLVVLFFSIPILSRITFEPTLSSFEWSLDLIELYPANSTA